LAQTEIALIKVSDIWYAFCSYEDAAEGLGIKVVQSALYYFVIHRGGNDQRDVKIISLAELLSCNLSIHQSRDRNECCPDRAEAPGHHSSVMNGQAEPKPGRSIRTVDIGHAGSEFAGIDGHQRKPVHTLRQYGEFPVPAWLTVPAFALEAGTRSGLGDGHLKIILGSGLFCRMTLAESCDVYRDEKPERQALKARRMHFSSG
jgi:hypothetical protein